MTHPESDRDLLRRSLDDPGLFGILFERHYADVLRYLERRMGNGIGEQLAAETFLLAFERRQTFDESRGDVRPWFFGIATNLLRNERRTEALVLRRRGELAEGIEDLSIETATDRLHAGAERGRLFRALARLDDEARDVVFLTAIGELSPREIGEVLGISASTVRTRLWRARSLLRTRLRWSDDAPPSYLQPIRATRNQFSIVVTPEGGNS